MTFIRNKQPGNVDRGNAVNDPAGSLKLDGIPASYSPGRPYVVTITLTRSELAKAGFQIASRFAEGADQGEEAGTWETTDERAKVIPSAAGDLHYAQQTRAGAGINPPGTARWSVRWIAPASAQGSVVFDVAANAADNDASPKGDFIYQSEVTSRAGN